MAIRNFSLSSVTSSTRYNNFKGAGVIPNSVDFLVVAGSSHGANTSNSLADGQWAGGGGGGAGGYRTSVGTSGGGAGAESKVSVTRNSGLSVTVGAAVNNSIFADRTSARGGAGVSPNPQHSNSGQHGGSGGGGSGNDKGGPGGGGGGLAGQGFAGGGGSGGRGGGGGGAAHSGSSPNGGPGITSSISGTSAVYASGGHAGTDPSHQGPSSTGGNAFPNTHAGGIIVRTEDFENAATVSPGLTFTESVSGGKRIYRFTGGTGTITWS